MSNQEHSPAHFLAQDVSLQSSPRPESPNSLEEAKVKEEEDLEGSSSDDRNITEKEYEEEIRLRDSTDISPEVLDGIEMERDLEAAPDLQKTKSSKSKRSVRDPNLVGWEGMDDVNNPKNWSSKRKWAATFVGKS